MKNSNKDSFLFPARQVFFAAGEIPSGDVEGAGRERVAPNERQELIAILGDSKINDLLGRARASLGRFNSAEASERLVSLGKNIFDECRQSVNKLNQAIQAAHDSLEGKPVITADKMKHLANQCWVNTKKSEMLSAGRLSQRGHSERGDVTYTFGDGENRRELKVSGYDVYVASTDTGAFVRVPGGPPFGDVKHPTYVPEAPKPKAPKPGADLVS